MDFLWVDSLVIQKVGSMEKLKVVQLVGLLVYQQVALMVVTLVVE